MSKALLNHLLPGMRLPLRVYMYNNSCAFSQQQLKGIPDEVSENRRSSGRNHFLPDRGNMRPRDRLVNRLCDRFLHSVSAHIDFTAPDGLTIYRVHFGGVHPQLTAAMVSRVVSAPFDPCRSGPGSRFPWCSSASLLCTP